MESYETSSPRVHSSALGKPSFETPTHLDGVPTLQFQDEKETYELKPRFVLKPKPRQFTSASSITENDSGSIFILSSPVQHGCFQASRRSSRSPGLMPSLPMWHCSNEEEDSAATATAEACPSTLRFPPLLPQVECCDDAGDCKIMRPQEFLTLRRTSMPFDLQG
jgi:hypothetical protein